MPVNGSSSSDRGNVKLELAEDDRPPATLTLEEYLHHVWRPDCDFVDGRSEERNVGILNQQIVITAMMVAMHNKHDEWRAQVIPGLRLRVSPTHVRVADLCLISDDAPDELTSDSEWSTSGSSIPSGGGLTGTGAETWSWCGAESL